MSKLPRSIFRDSTASFPAKPRSRDMTMDARIGLLNSGKFYAYVHGYDAEPVFGTLAQVSAALGRKDTAQTVSKTRHAKPQSIQTYTVRMTYEHPAWDEIDGIVFEGIRASSKSEANRIARRTADFDGHLAGRGRVFFTATPA